MAAVAADKPKQFLTLRRWHEEIEIKPGETVKPGELCEHEDGSPDTRLVWHEVGETGPVASEDWQTLVDAGTIMQVSVVSEALTQALPLAPTRPVKAAPIPVSATAEVSAPADEQHGG